MKHSEKEKEIHCILENRKVKKERKRRIHSLAMNFRSSKQTDKETGISLQSITSNELQRLNDLERNNGFLHLFKHNWRQLTALIPGKYM